MENGKLSFDDQLITGLKNEAVRLSISELLPLTCYAHLQVHTALLPFLLSHLKRVPLPVLGLAPAGLAST